MCKRGTTFYDRYNMHVYNMYSVYEQSEYGLKPFPNFQLIVDTLRIYNYVVAPGALDLLQRQWFCARCLPPTPLQKHLTAHAA